MRRRTTEEAEVVWAGAEALREVLVPVGEITLHPRNPWHGDIDGIAESLVRFGQVRAVLVEPDGTIVAGNHTYQAAIKLGWTHVAAIPNEFASAAEAEAYLLADNRIPQLGTYERAELLAILDGLEEAGRLVGTGYSPDDVATIRALEGLAAAPVAVPEPLPPLPAEPRPDYREVVLMFDSNDEGLFLEFGAHVQILRREYGAEGITETVLRAVHAAALRVNQGGPDE